MITTNVPNRAPIELVSYYESFLWYYPNCELNTKGWFVSNAHPDWVYLDCGANIGYYSILFSQLSSSGWVHAFEPTDTFDMLQKNISHNGVSNITLHRVAVGARSGEYQDKIFRVWGQEPEELSYPFTTLDDFVEESNLPRLDCIKIDVDSFDFEVLKGARETLLRYNPWVVVELNHALNLRGHNNMEALEWLAGLGYKEALVLDNDNFILRRDELHSAPSRNIQLHFPSSA